MLGKADRNLINDKFRGYTCIYTDGSRIERNNRGGFEIHIPEANDDFVSGIHDKMQIYSIETLAIYQGIYLEL